MRIGILISGRGSNMIAIADAVKSGLIPESEVAVVVSDKKEAQGLEKAKARGIETLVVEKNGRRRAEHDAEILGELRSRNVELVCLAGYMRLLSSDFVRAFPERILNVHPSLLPAFKGLEAQRQAIEYGVKVSGCTVHFVDEDLDHGAIVAQEIVKVTDKDTAETLAARILEQEHRLFVRSIARVVRGNYKIEGRRIVWL